MTVFQYANGWMKALSKLNSPRGTSSGREGTTMRFSKPTTVAEREDRRERAIPARILSCLVILMAFAAIGASAQIAINPPVTTTQYLGQPNVQAVINPVTGPLASIIMRGSAISAFTGLPVRHLWVADANFGLCRIDPELDASGPYAINVTTCPFKINGASITG